MSLYAIKSEMLGLLEAFDQFGAESPEVENAFREHAAALAEAFDSKADDYAALLRVAETRAAARKEESERIALLAASDEALAKRLREALMIAMQQTGRTKVDTDRFRLSVKRNGGKIPVEITDTAALPPEYMIPKVTHAVDRDAIRAALEAGTPVPGAALGERGWRLDLK
jgi:acyl transferase domain-containing protein